MSGLLRVLVWGLSDKNIEWARQGVGDMAKLKIAGDDLESLIDATAPPQVSVVLVGLDQGVDAALPIMSLCRNKNAMVAVVSPSKDSDLILKALRAGASEFVVAGDEADLQRALRRLAAVAAPHSICSVAAVYPVKGGVGATSIAVNLAGAFQSAGERVCLVDFGRYFGDVLAFLDLPNEYSIADVITNMRRLDRDLLDSSVMEHSSGIRVLAQVDNIDEAAQIRPSDVENLIRFLRQHYDRIILDGLRNFDDVSLAALDACDEILMVLTQDVPSVRDTQRSLEIFKRLGYADRKVKVILNRAESRSKIDTGVVEQVTGVPVAATINADFPLMIETINRGMLLHQSAPRSRLSRDFTKLAAFLRGDKPATRTSLFAGLFRPKEP